MITEKQKNKEKEERKYLDRFLRSSVGQLWLQENLINQSSLQKSEEPDFLFTTKDNKIIGVEIKKIFFLGFTTFKLSVIVVHTLKL